MIIKIILCIVGAYIITKAICWGSVRLAMMWAGIVGALRNYACWESLSDDQKMEEVTSIVKELVAKHRVYKLLLKIGSLDRQTSLLDELDEL